MFDFAYSYTLPSSALSTRNSIIRHKDNTKMWTSIGFNNV